MRSSASNKDIFDRKEKNNNKRIENEIENTMEKQRVVVIKIKQKDVIKDRSSYWLLPIQCFEQGDLSNDEWKIFNSNMTINWPASVISWSSAAVWAPRRRRPGYVDRSLAPMRPSRALQETSHIVFVMSPRNLSRGEGIIDNVDVSLVSYAVRKLGYIVAVARVDPETSSKYIIL